MSQAKEDAMRTLLTAAVAVVVTAVLFLLMQALIKDPIVVAVDPPAVPPVGRVEAPGRRRGRDVRCVVFARQ